MIGRPLGVVGSGGVAYEVSLDGRIVKIAVVVGSNGFIVTARPLAVRDKLGPL